MFFWVMGFWAVGVIVSFIYGNLGACACYFVARHRRRYGDIQGDSRLLRRHLRAGDSRRYHFGIANKADMT